jgi:hypothetical protein
MAAALRGHQRMAVDAAIGDMPQVAQTLQAQTMQEPELANQQAQRRMQGVQALREIATLKNTLRHQNVEEGQTGDKIANEQAQRERQFQIEMAKLGMEQWKLNHPEANKPAPEQVVQKLNNQLSAMGDIDALEKAQAGVGIGSAITGVVGPGVGAQGKYSDAIKAHAPAVAAASLPLGRETPESVVEEIGRMPPGYLNKDRAHAYWGEKRAAILENAEAQIGSLEGAGYSPTQVADLRARLEAAKAHVKAGGATAQGSPNGMPHGATRALRNKKTGAIRYLDANGNEVK